MAEIVLTSLAPAAVARPERGYKYRCPFIIILANLQFSTHILVLRKVIYFDVENNFYFTLFRFILNQPLSILVNRASGYLQHVFLKQHRD